MPKDKSDSHVKIIAAAKKEFLEMGFEKASMRSIAGTAGLTSAGLYRHFSDKEDMFSSLVAPVLEELEKVYGELRRSNYESLEKNSLDEMWAEGGEIVRFLDLIYDHFDEFKLLLCCSAGTRYENFAHDFVMLEQRETLAFMEAAKKRGIPVKEIREEELHLLLSAYITAVFEVVVHDFSREDAVHYVTTLQQFFYPGWRAVLGL